MSVSLPFAEKMTSIHSRWWTGKRFGLHLQRNFPALWGWRDAVMKYLSTEFGEDSWVEFETIVNHPNDLAAIFNIRVTLPDEKVGVDTALVILSLRKDRIIAPGDGNTVLHVGEDDTAHPFFAVLDDLIIDQLRKAKAAIPKRFRYGQPEPDHGDTFMRVECGASGFCAAPDPVNSTAE